MSEVVVITGATGFIGSAVVRTILAQGRRVIVITRTSSDKSRLRDVSGYEEVVADRLDDPSLSAKLREYAPTVFIHCAWRGVAGAERNQSWQISENVPFTIASVNLAAAAGCRQWIGLGSHAEYGNLNRVIEESAPTVPTTTYGKGKLAAGIAALALCEAHGIAGAWLRVFSTYGPGDAPHWLIPYAVLELAAGRSPKLTLCEQLWDYLHVTDAAEAIACVADGKTSGVFNLGHGRTWPLREIIETIRAAMGTPTTAEFGAMPYRPDQVMYLEADISKLTAATGWKPRIGLVDGIKETVNYFCHK